MCKDLRVFRILKNTGKLFPPQFKGKCPASLHSVRDKAIFQTCCPPLPSIRLLPAPLPTLELLTKQNRQQTLLLWDTHSPGSEPQNCTLYGRDTPILCLVKETLARLHPLHSMPALSSAAALLNSNQRIAHEEEHKIKTKQTSLLKKGNIKKWQLKDNR